MRRFIILSTVVFGLSACLSSEDDATNSADFTPPTTGIAATTQDSDYQELSSIQKYEVSNKLLATLYKGLPAKDFFDFSGGTKTLELKSTENQLEIIKIQLSTPEKNYSKIITYTNNFYFSDGENAFRRSPIEVPLTYMHELPLSSEFFDMWIAYQLTNTILFSPAVELESVDNTDIEAVFNNLYFWMQAGLSVREIVYLHMTSQENWRRFRSPEDNTREMLEIFLKRFDDTEVPLASTACKNWYLTDDNLHYKLIKKIDINQDPQTLIDTNNIVTCEDFYRELSHHVNLIPAVTSRIVEYMLPYSTAEVQESLTTAIAASKPKTFRDIFTSLIFSKTYLYDEEKIQRFEETFFNTANRIDWVADNRYFRNLNSESGGANQENTNLHQMKQKAMTYKLGRNNKTPVDTLSFAYYLNAIRFNLFLDRRTNPDSDTDQGWILEKFINNDNISLLNDAEFIDYVFIAILSRKPNQAEIDALNPIIENKNKGDKTSIIMDYISRLEDLYTFNAINKPE